MQEKAVFEKCGISKSGSNPSKYNAGPIILQNPKKIPFYKTFLQQGTRHAIPSDLAGTSWFANMILESRLELKFPNISFLYLYSHLNNLTDYFFKHYYARNFWTRIYLHILSYVL